MKARVVGCVLVVAAIAAHGLGAMQADGWTGVFTLAPGSYAFGAGHPLVGGSPADVWAPAPVPEKTVPREKISWPQLGITATGVVDAFSAGRDECNTGFVFFFYSVTYTSVGIPGLPVNRQVLGNGAAGDIFVVVGKGCPAFRGISVEQDAPQIVLQPGPGASPPTVQDEMNALDVPFVYESHESPVYFSVNPATAAAMAAASGLPVTAGDLLVSDGKGNWDILYPWSELGLASSAVDIDALAYDEALDRVWFSVAGPLGSPAAGGLNPATIYLVPNPGPSAIVSIWIPPSVMGVLTTDNVDAISILDPDSFFGTGHNFLSLDFTQGGTASLVEEGGVPGGLPDGTLWHPEAACDVSYSVGTSFTPFGTIQGNPATVPLFPSCADDANSNPVALGIPFSYFGAPVQEVLVNTNGFLTFDDWLPGLNQVGLAFSNATAGNPAAPQAIVAPFWDDLQAVDPTAFVGVLSDPINQKFTVEWNWLSTWVGPGPCTDGGNRFQFQTVLHTAGDQIEFVYGSWFPSSASVSATIGIENWSGRAGLSPPGWGTNTNSSLPPVSFLFSPSANSLPTSFNAWAMAYNRGDLGFYDYDTSGLPNQGSLRTRPFAVPLGAKNLSLSFEYSKEMDGLFDQAWVEVRPTFPAAAPWSPVSPFSPFLAGNQGCASSTTFLTTANPVGSLKGQGGGVRFRVNTVNASANTGRGWLVDDVKIQGGPVAFLQQFGTGCIPAGGAVLPRIGANSAPVSPTPPATTFDVTLSNGLPSVFAFLAFGLDSAPVAIPIPGNPNCFLELDPALILGVLGAPANPSGSATRTFVIPPGISGNLWMQWAQATAGPMGLQFAMSDAAVVAVR
jgi:hypothetical protein